MQAPITPGSVLRDRYLVKAAIAQGGMGRTYVAEDLERFNELCVLKEFILSNPSAAVVAKAKELFQREASILYQIRHPQIPEFRATFELAGGLFLVQDFVEGKTFRDLLSDRGRQGQVFSEAEMIKLLWQVLPILAYLHDRNIIHRDISPENLMQRSQDNLPVLIDFGVGKAAANQLMQATSAWNQTAGTMVGKLGYAPPEQMQTGRAFASSDLYALAVTVIVLLTGREPQDLYDDQHLAWTWQSYAQVSLGFAKILERMLSYKPAQRYARAEEVIEALQLLQASALDQKTLAIAQPARGKQTPIPQQTAYYGAIVPGNGSSQNTAGGNIGNNNGTVTPANYRRSGINLGLGIFLAIAAGLLSWVTTSLILNRANPFGSQPQPSPKPTVVAPINVTRSLEFAPGADQAEVSDRVIAGQVITYQLVAKKRQTMTVRLEGTGLQMTLNYEDQKPIDQNSKAVDVGYWRGKLPASGAYFILIQPSPGTKASDYKLEVQIENAEPLPSPAPPKPLPSPDPTPPETPIPIPSPTDTPKPLPIPSPTPIEPLPDSPGLPPLAPVNP